MRDGLRERGFIKSATWKLEDIAEAVAHGYQTRYLLNIGGGAFVKSVGVSNE